MKIETIGDNVTKASLTKISVDPELDGFMVVLFMKDDTTRLAWSTMSNEQLAFGKTMLGIEVDDVLRSQRGDE